MTMFAGLQQLLGGGQAPGATGTLTQPGTAGTGATGAVGPDALADSVAKSALLQSIGIREPDVPRPPQTPLTSQPGAINPEISQQLLAAMMGTQGRLPPSLGQILGGA